MANPTRGEVDFKFATADGEDRHYTFKFSNAGRRAMEDALGMEAPEINMKLDTGQVGPRVLSALLFGATRKFHARQLPSMNAIDALMDAIDEADEEVEGDTPNGTELFLAIASAYLRVDKKELRERMEGGAPPEEEDPKAEKKAKAEPKAEKSA